jgi:hypothetical protein
VLDTWEGDQSDMREYSIFWDGSFNIKPMLTMSAEGFLLHDCCPFRLLPRKVLSLSNAYDRAYLIGQYSFHLASLSSARSVVKRTTG